MGFGSASVYRLLALSKQFYFHLYVRVYISDSSRN
jgi:hypothetical protein